MRHPALRDAGSATGQKCLLYSKDVTIRLIPRGLTKRVYNTKK